MLELFYKKWFEARHAVPLIDYHPDMGLTMGIHVDGGRKWLVIVKTR